MLKASLGNQQPWLAQERDREHYLGGASCRNFQRARHRPCVDIRHPLFIIPAAPKKLAMETGLCQQRHAKADTEFECCEVRGTRQGRDMTKILADRVKKGTGTPTPWGADNTQDGISGGTLGAVTEMIKLAARWLQRCCCCCSHPIKPPAYVRKHSAPRFG